MRELSGKASALKVSIAKGQARLEELNTMLRDLGLETGAARPKSSLDPKAIKEKLRQRKAQLANAGNAPTAAPVSQQSGGQAQLANAGIASSTTPASDQVTGIDSTANADGSPTEHPAPLDADKDTEMADSGNLVDVNRSYAAMLADPSQWSKHAPEGPRPPNWNPGTPYQETPGKPKACLLY